MLGLFSEAVQEHPEIVKTPRSVVPTNDNLPRREQRGVSDGYFCSVQGRALSDGDFTYFALITMNPTIRTHVIAARKGPTFPSRRLTRRSRKNSCTPRLVELCLDNAKSSTRRCELVRGMSMVLAAFIT